MIILNSAVFRNNLANVLEEVVMKKEPVLIGRFGQPKAVLVDMVTYNWQKQILNLVSRINSLSKSEIETLNILLDAKLRSTLLAGLEQAYKGEVVSLEKFLED